MKPNFLKQIARMLIFSLFVTGLPIDIQAASPASNTSSSSTGPSCPGCTDVILASTGVQLSAGVTLTSSQAATVLSTPAPKGCSGFSASSCSLNSSCMAFSSNNTPSTFDLSGVKALMGSDYTEQNNAIASYLNTAKYLLAASTGYQAAMQNYTQLKLLYAAFEQLVTNNLYVNPCALDPANNSSQNDPLGLCPTTNPNPGGWTPGILPFTATNMNVPARVSPNGDFMPIGNLNTTQKGQLMLGYLQYLYNFEPGQSGKNWIAQAATMLIFYTILSKQMSFLNDYFFGWSAFAGVADDNGWLKVQNSSTLVPGEGQQPANQIPTPQQALQFIQQSSYAGYNKDTKTSQPSDLFQFNSNIPSATLNLLSALANAQWSSVDPDYLYTVVSGMDLNAVTATFSSSNMSGGDANTLAWIPGLLANMQALTSDNLYFNCSVDLTTGKGIDGSLYYGVNTSQASAKLSDQFVSVQLTMIQQATGANNQDTSSISTTLPAALSDYVVNYMKGSFYPFLPSSVAATSENDATEGPISLAGLNNGADDMMPGSLWATACANSTSSKLAAPQAAILNQIQLVSDLESPVGVNDNSGAPTMPGKTVQGAAQNLITAAQAAIAQPPLAAYASSAYSWINASYPPTKDSPLTGINLSVTPNILSEFVPKDAQDTAAFATVDHLNMLLDIGTVMLSYHNCWNNLSYCANGGVSGGPASSGATCKASNLFTQKTCAMKGVGLVWETLQEIRQQFNTPFGALMMLFMGYQLVHGFMSQFSGRITSYLNGQKAADDLVAKYKALANAEATKLQGGGYDNTSGKPFDPSERLGGSAADARGTMLDPIGNENDTPSTPGEDVPGVPGEGIPGVPGEGIPGVPPVAESTFEKTQQAISSQLQNVENLDEAQLDQAAEEVLEEKTQADTDKATGEANAEEEEVTAEKNEQKISEQARSEGDSDAPIEELEDAFPL